MQITGLQFQRLARDWFNRRLTAVIRDAYPTLSAGIDDAQFEEAFDVLVPVAQSYGLVDEQSAASFIHAAWLFGDGFDVRIPVIAQILGDPVLAPEVKVKALGDFSRIVFGILCDERRGVPA